MHNTPFAPSALPRLATACGFYLLVAACSQSTLQPAAPTEAQSCVSLRQVLGQAGSEFQSLRGSATVDYDHTRWDARPVLPGTHCDVISWGGGRTNYACTWNKGDEAVARADFENGLGVVERCLGAGWERSSPAGQTGRAVLFSKAGESAKVEVRYYQERAPSRNWQTSLTIGPPVTRDAR